MRADVPMTQGAVPTSNSSPYLSREIEKEVVILLLQWREAILEPVHVAFQVFHAKDDATVWPEIQLCLHFL